MARNPVVVMLMLAALLLTACSEADSQRQSAPISRDASQDSVAKITFVELGSVNCVPCKAMQPVMQSVERKYGDQIRVVFYDVWTPEEQKYARSFGIRIIPTQVFLDQHGNEIMRHEGFFAEAEIDRFLHSHGLNVLQGS
jgi:thioredoxin 1